jgi:hypothetical protein
VALLVIVVAAVAISLGRFLAHRIRSGLAYLVAFIVGPVITIATFLGAWVAQGTFIGFMDPTASVDEMQMVRGVGHSLWVGLFITPLAVRYYRPKST